MSFDLESFFIHIKQIEYHLHHLFIVKQIKYILYFSPITKLIEYRFCPLIDQILHSSYQVFLR